MKKLICIISLLALSIVATCQLKKDSLVPLRNESEINGDNSKYNFCISVGPSIPLLDFGSSSQVNSQAGYAEIGFHYDVSAQIQILSTRVGFMVFIGGNVNSLNLYNYTHYNDYTADLASNGISIIKATDKYYFVGEYLGGLTFQFPLNKTLLLNINALCGIVTVNSPVIEYMDNNYSPPSTFNRSVEPFETGFAGRISLGLKELYSEHWSMIYSISFTNSYVGSNLYLATSLGLLAPSIGVSYRFGYAL